MAVFTGVTGSGIILVLHSDHKKLHACNPALFDLIDNSFTVFGPLSLLT